MQPRSFRSEPRLQPEQPEDPISQRRRLLAEIEQQNQHIYRIDEKLNNYDKELKKLSESNERNAKRLLRHRAKLKQLYTHRNQPQYFLHICGFMNEYMQEFMLAHDVHMNINMNMSNEAPNVDNMSYEQLLELGESIGKVSKGITKEQFESLPRRKNISSEHNCPICCTEFSIGEVAVALKCKHFYHEECIMEWLKDENSCPICKSHVLA